MGFDCLARWYAWSRTFARFYRIDQPIETTTNGRKVVRGHLCRYVLSLEHVKKKWRRGIVKENDPNVVVGLVVQTLIVAYCSLCLGPHHEPPPSPPSSPPLFCAAPAVALAYHGLIGEMVPSTCYPVPKFRDMLSNAITDEAVVVSGPLITSQGPGTAIQFALQLGEELYGQEKRMEIAKEMLVE